MLCRELIKQLESLIEANKPYEDIEGAATIEIDKFRWNETKQAFDYIGIDHDIKITKTADGVYNVLTAIEE